MSRTPTRAGSWSRSTTGTSTRPTRSRARSSLTSRRPTPSASGRTSRQSGRPTSGSPRATSRSGRPPKRRARAASDGPLRPSRHDRWALPHGSSRVSADGSIGDQRASQAGLQGCSKGWGRSAFGVERGESQHLRGQQREARARLYCSLACSWILTARPEGSADMPQSARGIQRTVVRAAASVGKWRSKTSRIQ